MADAEAVEVLVASAASGSYDLVNPLRHSCLRLWTGRRGRFICLDLDYITHEQVPVL
jgi:hypothetical protein